MQDTSDQIKLIELNLQYFVKIAIEVVYQNSHVQKEKSVYSLVPQVADIHTVCPLVALSHRCNHAGPAITECFNLNIF